MSTSSAKLRTWLERYAFALACALAILLAVILLVLGPELSREEVFSSIGLNLLAAVIFALVFTTLSTRLQQHNLLEKQEELFVRLSAEMREDLGRTAARHLPVRTYAESDSFNEQFNRDVSLCLQGSGDYSFKGTSAKYVPARVRSCHKQPQRIRVITLDPRSEAVMRRRATDRRQQDAHRNSSLNDLVASAREEIHMSLVALFDIRHSCLVEVVLSEETAVTRVEMFDDAVFVSWYQSPTSTKRGFPETWRFERRSVPYDIAQLEINRRFEIADADIIRFTSGQRDDHLVDVLRTLTNSSVSQADVDALRAKYERFIESFEEMIRKMA